MPGRAGALSVAAAKFDSAVELIVGAGQADAKSVLAVMQLGASSGQQVTIRATGPDAGDAVATIIAILAGAARRETERGMRSRDTRFPGKRWMC